MTKKAVVLLADGFEEVEAVTPIDYLRRAGIDVTVAAVSSGAAGSDCAVKGAHGITVNADVTLGELMSRRQAGVDLWDAVVIPGGMPGSATIAASTEAGALITEMAAAGKWVCAICAAPAVVLAPLGLLSGKPFTCYPGMEEAVQGGHWTDRPVVIAANAGGGIITSRAAGTAGSFAVTIIGQLLGADAGEAIAKGVLL